MASFAAIDQFTILQLVYCITDFHKTGIVRGHNNGNAFFIGEFLETGHWQFTNIENCEEGMTMAFLTMSMCEIFHSFNMRSQRGSAVAMSFSQKSHNIVLYAAMVLSLVLTTAIIEVPFLADMFEFTHLDLKAYAISIGLAFLVIPIVEIIKAIQRAAAKNK